MMKKQLMLAFYLVGLFSSNMMMGRSSEGVFGLVVGGSAVSAGAGYVAHKIIETFNGKDLKDTSKTAVLGSIAVAFGFGALSVQKYLEHNNVKDSFHTPAKLTALLIGALTFAGLEYNKNK